MIHFLKKIIDSERALIIFIGSATSVIFLFLYLVQPTFLRFIDLKLYDQLLRTTHTSNTTGVPVIVDIDERTLEDFGQWPWYRTRVTLLLARLAQAGASSIAMDIVFAEPDQTSPVQVQNHIVNEMGGQIDFKNLTPGLMDFDKVLAGFLPNGPFVLGYFLDFERSDAKRDGACLLRPVKTSIITKPGGKTLAGSIMTPRGVVCPLAPLTNNGTQAMGYFNTISDEDGILRKVPLLAEWKGKILPSLALQAYMTAAGIDQVDIRMGPAGIESFRVGRSVIPVDSSGSLYVKFRGPSHTFQYISAGDVLNQNYPKDFFKGKIVLLGTSAAGLKDIRATPFDQYFPGVETHANIIDNILTNDFVIRPDWALGFEAFLTLLAGVAITLLLAWAKATWIFIPLLLSVFGMWEGSVWLMRSMHMYVSPLYALIILLLNFTLLTMLKFWYEERNKKFYQATFSSYLSPDLIQEMVKSKTMPSLGGEAKVITAYFTDIQSFSTFSEKLTAEQLVELLNEYLSVMTDILLDDRGTLDKYEGDAIIAFIGAPMDVPDHALRACRIAVSMQKSLLELRKKWSTEKQQPGENRNSKNLGAEEWGPGDKWPKVVHQMLMRIGINSGEMVVGNMGSAMRMNYTMMGDAVNLAARLEAGAKQYGIYTAASQYTLELPVIDEEGVEHGTVLDHVEARLIDSIIVVGKSEPVKVYEVCAMKDGLTEEEKVLFDLFDKGRRLYQEMRWDEAAELFEKAMEFERVPEGKTTPSEVFLKRCREFKKTPPVPSGQAWDGVYRMTKKQEPHRTP